MPEALPEPKVPDGGRAAPELRLLRPMKKEIEDKAIDIGEDRGDGAVLPPFAGSVAGSSSGWQLHRSLPDIGSISFH